MKRLLILFFVICSVGYGQVSNKAEVMVRKDTAKVFKVSLSDRAYNSLTIDTTIVYQAEDWKNVYVTIQSEDSARCRIKYQLSTDGSTWGVMATKDSLSTAEATGDLKSVDLTANIIGAQYFRIAFDFANAHQYEDSTTARDKYNAQIAARAYANGFSDTTEWLLADKYRTLNLHATTLDSARFVFTYQTASDTTNVSSAQTVVDSLVTADNAGATKSVDMDASLDDSTWVRFIIKAGAGNFGQGTTSATYTAWYEYEIWVNGFTSNRYTAILTRKQD